MQKTIVSSLSATLRVGVGRGGNEGHRERHLRKVLPLVERK